MRVRELMGARGRLTAKGNACHPARSCKVDASNRQTYERRVSTCVQRAGGTGAAADDSAAEKPGAHEAEAAQRSAAASKRQPKQLRGRFLIQAIERDPSTMMVDALLAHSTCAKELDAKAIEALRAREAALQDEEVDLRADKVYRSALDRVRRARKRASGQEILDGSFMVAAVQRDPSTTLLDALLAESAVAEGLASEDAQALRKLEAELQGDPSVEQRKRAHLLYHAARGRRDQSQRRRAEGVLCHLLALVPTQTDLVLLFVMLPALRLLVCTHLAPRWQGSA